jgi:hypothetical protein
MICATGDMPPESADDEATCGSAARAAFTVDGKCI